MENLEQKPDNAFARHLSQQGLSLKADRCDTLQINVGKLCNQACKHCHVDAGPGRTEIMARETVDEVLRILQQYKIGTLDITGGAPELNPSFTYLVTAARSLGVHVIVRHNLTVIFTPGQENLPEFFRDQQVELVSSLPYFLEEQTDAQRGRGVFERSLAALRRLNAVGYGMNDNGLQLHLVYNPVGAFLPPPQASIEADFKREMAQRYGIAFNSLYTITNMPIKRFLDYLRRSGNKERYERKLLEAFNPQTVSQLMCRNLVSVSWEGYLYDCDFNQMAELPLLAPAPRHISQFSPHLLEGRTIVTAAHCFGCTAGAGSSCSGAVAA